MITNVGGKCKKCGQQKRTVLSFRDVFYECDCSNSEERTTIKPNVPVKTDNEQLKGGA